MTRDIASSHATAWKPSYPYSNMFWKLFLDLELYSIEDSSSVAAFIILRYSVVIVKNNNKNLATIPSYLPKMKGAKLFLSKPVLEDIFGPKTGLSWTILAHIKFWHYKL